jgi:hypothetical protein
MKKDMGFLKKLKFWKRSAVSTKYRNNNYKTGMCY